MNGRPSGFGGVVDGRTGEGSEDGASGKGNKGVCGREVKSGGVGDTEDIGVRRRASSGVGKGGHCCGGGGGGGRFWVGVLR